MAFLRDITHLLRRLAALPRRRRLDDELRAEIVDHIDRRRQQLVDGGMDPAEAELEARRLFGNATVIRERTRDLRSLRWLDALVQDARFGLRLLVRTPLFSAVAVLSLALGVGAAVAVFTVADAVVFRPLPVRSPGELRSFHVDVNIGGGVKTLTGVPEPAVASLQSGATLADFIGFRTSDEVAFGLDQGAATRMTRVEFVTPNYFSVLGVSPETGRPLDRQDDRVTPVPVVVSERLWAAVAGPVGAIGRAVSLNGRPAVVVGVTRRFTGVNADRPADVFAPLSAGSMVDPTQANFIVQLLARLRPGVSTAAAEENLASLYRVTMPGLSNSAQIHATMRDAANGISGAREALERPLRLSLALVAVLVFIACANTSALLLSRFVTRRGEFGVRIAIGAGRSRLARQLAVEALIVAVAAAGLGLAAGWLAAPLLMRSMPETGAQVAFALRLDHRVLLFTAALTLVCGLGTAAAPLIRLWRADGTALLNGEARTLVAGSRRITRVLIAAQVACSLLLIVGAVSMARTMANLRSVSLGFDSARLFVVNVNAAGLRPASEMAAFHRELHERIAAVPGVGQATMAQLGVLTSSSTIGSVDVAGFTPAADEDRITRIFFVGPDYFGTLGIPLTAGRGFLAQDFGPRTTAAIVNERFATFYFGSPANALDRIVNRDIRIAGIVADAHFNTPRDEPPRVMFVPFPAAQRPSMAHIVRAAGDPAAAMRAVLDVVRAYDARLRPRIATADELLDAALARERFFTVVAWVLSALALTLACGGLYAAVAYAVSQRHAELAVRVALGAAPRDVILLVLRDPLTTTIAGIAAGVPGAWLLMRSATALLFGVAPFDAATVAICAAALILFALAAATRPALRALRIDPVPALRSS